MIWWEKYRPKTLEDMILPKAARDKIEKEFKTEIPNLLLCGPQGTGKTTLARILVQDILKCDYLYINASDENGIDNIRSKVSGFVQTKSFNGGIKVVILDEADFLSNSAMAALRNTMESYLGNARFILTGNYKHKIIAPIQSRCQSLDIQPTFKDVLKRCFEILVKENIIIPKEQRQLIANSVKSNYPDFRQCIDILQKNCVDGEMAIGSYRNLDTLCLKMFDDIKNKKTIDLRTFLIENESLFGGDYEKLLHTYLNFLYSHKMDDSAKKAMILTTADHIWKMSSVIDREINCFACLLNLETI